MNWVDWEKSSGWNDVGEWNWGEYKKKILIKVTCCGRRGMKNSSTRQNMNMYHYRMTISRHTIRS